MHTAASFLANGLDPQPRSPPSEDCSICLLGLTDPVGLPCECKYIYCRECISEWIETQGKCPTCRREFVQKPMTLNEFMGSDQSPPIENFDIPWEAAWASDYQFFMDRVESAGLVIGQHEETDDTFIDVRILAVQIVRMGNRFVARRALEGRPMTEDEIEDLTFLLNGLYNATRMLEGQRMNAELLRRRLYGLLFDVMVEIEDFRLAQMALDAGNSLVADVCQAAVAEIIDRVIGTAWALEAAHFL